VFFFFFLFIFANGKKNNKRVKRVTPES